MGNGPFWSSCTVQSWFRYGMEIGGPFKIVDQTRKLQPNVNNISNVCFCLLKEPVTNLHIESSCLIINFLRDKPLFNTKDCHGAKR